jgi:hypothetical protein
MRRARAQGWVRSSNSFMAGGAARRKDEPAEHACSGAVGSARSVQCCCRRDSGSGRCIGGIGWLRHVLLLVALGGCVRRFLGGLFRNCSSPLHHIGARGDRGRASLDDICLRSPLLFPRCPSCPHASWIERAARGVLSCRRHSKSQLCSPPYSHQFNFQNMLLSISLGGCRCGTAFPRPGATSQENKASTIKEI